MKMYIQTVIATFMFASCAMAMTQEFKESWLKEYDERIDSASLALIKETEADLKNTIANRPYLKNMVFKKPICGRIQILQRMGLSAGIGWAYFSAAGYLDANEEEGVEMIRNFFENNKRHAKQMGKPIILGIGEAELVLGKRSNPAMTNKQRALMNEILKYIGTPTHEYMVVAFTDTPEDLDEAFLSRCQ